jgi:hypothetical protein
MPKGDKELRLLSFLTLPTALSRAARLVFSQAAPHSRR